MLTASVAAGAEKQEEKTLIKFIGLINNQAAFQSLHWIIRKKGNGTEYSKTKHRFEMRLPAGEYSVEVKLDNHLNKFNFEVLEENQEVVTNFKK